EHPQSVIHLRIVGGQGHGTLQSLLRLAEPLLAAIDVSQVVQSEGVIGALADRLLKITDGLSVLARLRRKQSEVVERVGILGAQLQRAEKMATSLVRLPLLQIECSQVVMRLGVSGIGFERQSEFPNRLVEVSCLRISRAIGELVPLELAQVELPGKRQRQPCPLFRSLRDALAVRVQALGIDGSLIDLHDESLGVEKKG